MPVIPEKAVLNHYQQSHCMMQIYFTDICLLTVLFIVNVFNFLCNFRMEASSCPKVVVANIDTKPFAHKQTVHVKHVSDPY